MRTLLSARLRAKLVIERWGRPPREPDKLLQWATAIVSADADGWTVQVKDNLDANGLIVGRDKAINIHAKLRDDIALFRFTVLHELGHFLLHPRLRLLTRTTRDAMSQFRAEDLTNRQSRFDWEEADADAFAAEALCPAADLLAGWDATSSCTLKSLAALFAVPLEAVQRQLKRALADECEGPEIQVASINGLSNEQREAARQPVDQMTYVNAGPGTGKTTTVLERVRWLVNELGIEPSNVNVLSYSNSAVRTFRQRLQQTNNPRLSCVAVHTIHSLALEILRIERGPDAPVPRVIDEPTHLQRIRDVLEEAPPDGFNPVRLTAELKRLDKEYKIRQEDSNASAKKKLPDAKWDPLFEQVDELLDQQNEVTFSVALARALEKVRAAPDRWSGEYPYLIVDEAQDLSEQQLQLILSLSQPDRRPWFAGDHRQRIYGFQGATARLRTMIKNVAPEQYKEITLLRNFRQTSTMLDGVIGISHRIDVDDGTCWKANHVDADEFDCAMCRTITTDEAAIDATCGWVMKRIEQGAAKRSIVVLTRTNDRSATVVARLRRYGIAAFVPGGLELDGVGGDLGNCRKIN